MQIGGKLAGNWVSLTICRTAGLNFRDTEASEFLKVRGFQWGEGGGGGGVCGLSFSRYEVLAIVCEAT